MEKNMKRIYICMCLCMYNWMGFPGGSDGKKSICHAGDLGLIPGSGRSPGGGHGNPLQYFCLEKPHGQRNMEGYSPRGHKGSTRLSNWAHDHWVTLLYDVINTTLYTCVILYFVCYISVKKIRCLTAWMDLEDIKLNKVKSSREWKILQDIPYMWNLNEWKKEKLEKK